MRVQLLPSTIDEDGRASARQHLMSIIIDDRVAIDAGCLAFSCTELQRQQVRDIILTHTHLDHIAGLPMFIDDLFATLNEPIRVHATKDVIETLERDIFNWAVYPRFSELMNKSGRVVEYHEFKQGSKFSAQHLTVTSVGVNHKVAASGYVVSDGKVSVGITGDTAETEDIWSVLNTTSDLKAVLVECAFPNEMSELAAVSNHLTPQKLERELEKFTNQDCEVYVINLKPMYRDTIVKEIGELTLRRLNVLEVGKVYEW
ncbi:MAG: 3',5'-cyclic-nucleotide phosphodiesterase [Chloracidobacterium sp.]|nr:3',5'-cyclic-nucleotide phosphodiesterase [Chloracidobacterium sp.]